MDPYLFYLILILLVLIIISGIFSLFNSALGLCRKSRLEKEQGKHYKTVIKTLENPRIIFFTCRLWIIIFNASSVCFGMVIWIYITYQLLKLSFSWITFAAGVLIMSILISLFCEALPKLLARTKPEKIAASLMPVMKFLSFPMMVFALPAIKFELFFNKAFKPEIDDNNITEEELQDELLNTLMEGEKSGVVESKERDMVEGVFYLGDRPVGAFMTHRSEIQWLDINSPYEDIREKAIEYRQQRCFPVVNASPDEIIGAVYLEDIVLDYTQHVPQGLRVIMKKPQFVPETMPAIKAFESFKQGQSNFLFVMDEYGGLAGIISITALVEEIVGELSISAANEKPLLRQEDGSYLADGTLNIDDAVKELGLSGLDEDSDFHTLAGLILHLAGELPRIGDSVEYQGYRFKVIDKDGNRIDKILITQI
ncbi:MAG: hemolysin family protein [Treponema sp.]|nr:hemolysin family protein [Treponema sp.]